MSSLKEQVNKTAMLLNDIKVALEDRGVDTSNMTPKDYANAIRGVVNNITIDNISLIPVLIFKYSENRPDRPDGGS
jgi:DNA gyrase/topoisomerase IV subunit B